MTTVTWSAARSLKTLPRVGRSDRRQLNRVSRFIGVSLGCIWSSHEIAAMSGVTD
jgi:hypothetical protein